MADVFQVGFDWKVLALYSNHSNSIIQYHNSAWRWQPQIHTVLTNYDTNNIYIHIHTHKFHLEIWKKQRDREIQKPLRNSTGEQENSLGQEQFISLVSPCDILINMAVSLSPATKKGFLDTWEINYLWALKKPMEKEPIFQNTRPQQANVAFDPPLSGIEERRGRTTKKKKDERQRENKERRRPASICVPRALRKSFDLNNLWVSTVSNSFWHTCLISPAEGPEDSTTISRAVSPSKPTNQQPQPNTWTFSRFEILFLLPPISLHFFKAKL